MAKLFKTISFLILLLTVAVTYLFFTVIESHTNVIASSSEQVNQADSVKKLIKQLSDSVKNRTNKQDIHISQNQLNSLVGFAQRAHEQSNGRVHNGPN